MSNYYFSQFGARVFRSPQDGFRFSWAVALVGQAVLHRVLHVLPERTPLKVAYLIIRGIAVYVVNLLPKLVRRWADKGQRHQAVKAIVFGLALAAQAHLSVAAFIARLVMCQKPGFVFGGPMKSFYSAQIRDFVQSLVAGNRLPNFGHRATVA